MILPYFVTFLVRVFNPFSIFLALETFLPSAIRMHNFMKLPFVVCWNPQNEFQNLIDSYIFTSNQIYKKSMFQSSSLRRKYVLLVIILLNTQTYDMILILAYE